MVKAWKSAVLLASLMLLTAQPGLAADEAAEEGSQGVPMVTPRPKIIVSREQCRRLTRHVPAADVAYRPGVDVRGRAVVGADLEPERSRIRAPDALTFDLQRSVPGFADAPWENTGVTVATVTVTRSGRVSVNGQLIAADEERDLVKACRETFGRR